MSLIVLPSSFVLDRRMKRCQSIDANCSNAEGPKIWKIFHTDIDSVVVVECPKTGLSLSRSLPGL